MEFKDDRKYLESHEWLKMDGKIGSIGVTDYAQSEMGDVVFVELPEEGDEVTAGEECATVESVKAVFGIVSPVTGKVIEVNEDVLDSPELINEGAFDAWFIKIEVEGESDKLITVDEYKALCK